MEKNIHKILWFKNPFKIREVIYLINECFGLHFYKGLQRMQLKLQYLVYS